MRVPVQLSTSNCSFNGKNIHLSCLAVDVSVKGRGQEQVLKVVLAAVQVQLLSKLLKFGR